MTRHFASRSGACSGFLSHRASALVVAVALLVPPACSGPPSPAESGAPDKVRAVVLPYMPHLSFHIAQQEGFFAEQSLDVEFLRMGRSQEFMAALANGDVDVTAGMLSVNELNLAAAGARIRLVGALAELDPERCAFVSIRASKHLAEAGALDDPEQLRGAVVDTDLLTPLGFQVDEHLRSIGLSVDDVQVQNIPPPAAVEALRTGAIGIMVEAEPFLTMHEAAGASIAWRHVGEVAPGFPQSVMVFGPRLLDERPEVGKRFAAAMLQGMRRLREGKTARNLEIAVEATGRTHEQLQAACWPVPPEDGRIDPSTIAAYQEWSAGRGLIDRPLRAEELIDSRFFDHANAELAR